jgi:hypothetical protein
MDNRRFWQGENMGNYRNVYSYCVTSLQGMPVKGDYIKAGWSKFHVDSLW